MRPALISIHDVMPSTLDAVETLIGELAARDLVPTTLLVVPGLAWDDAGRARLRAWQAAGHELAAHGWSHRAPAARGWKHRLHAALISRQCGEHLSRSRADLVDLLCRSHDWFAANGLQSPRLYVPPAWALGELRPADLAATRFDLVESTAGVRHVPTGRFRWLPCIGFEADRRWRAHALRALNGLARATARAAGPLRIAIHPHDLELYLATDLRRVLDRVGGVTRYAALFDDAQSTRDRPTRQPLR